MTLTPEPEFPSAPEGNQTQEALANIDQSLLTQFASGPSSLIDQEVVGAISRLKNKENPPSVWKLILNPKAAYTSLQAFWGETNAYTNARRAIAQATLTQVRFGEEDLTRDTLLAYMTSLKTSLGPMLPEFCNQHGVEIAPENSIAEMLQLLRLNHAIVSVAKYQQALAKQMERYIKTRTHNEAALAISQQRKESLPGLIQSQRDSFPLQRQVVFQNVSHTSSMLGGIPAAALGGLVGGSFEGLRVGVDTGIKWAGEKLRNLKEKFIKA